MVSDEEGSSGGGETFEGLKSGFVPFPPKGFGVVAHLTSDWMGVGRNKMRKDVSLEL